MFFNTLTIDIIIKLICFIEFSSILGAILMFLSNKKVDKETSYKRWIKYIFYFFIVHIMIILTSLQKPLIIIILSILNFICFIEFLLISKKTKIIWNTPVKYFIAMAIILTVFTLNILFTINSNGNIILFTYIIIAILDAYSQLIGQLFGKHKLAPIISPNKTIEGAFGGMSFAVFSAIVLKDMININSIKSLILGIIISLSGIFGDLISSYYKRIIGVKDYSNILPGQGGFIDRFISFLVATAILFIFSFLYR